jgi:PPOX class probable FMN-dependent enzyme
MAQIKDMADLEKLYGEVAQPALAKEIDHISDDYRQFIDKSPFVVVATVGPEGLDCSPRGDPAGFCRVADPKTVLIPDRRGNNRVDSLRNVVRDPRISLLFIIPGVGNTLRINGRAEIRDDADLLAQFAMGDKLPRTVLKVTADRVYFQCPKAFVRSKLWDPSAQISRSELPSTGDMLARLTKGGIDGAAYDASYPQRLKETMY